MSPCATTGRGGGILILLKRDCQFNSDQIPVTTREFQGVAIGEGDHHWLGEERKGCKEERWRMQV